MRCGGIKDLDGQHEASHEIVFVAEECTEHCCIKAEYSLFLYACVMKLMCYGTIL